MAEPLVVARDLPRPPAQRPRPGQKLPAALTFRLARWSRSELIVGDALVVEHRVWSGHRDPDQHVVRPNEGCVRRGLACKANEAIQAAVDAGFDPFA